VTETIRIARSHTFGRRTADEVLPTSTLGGTPARTRLPIRIRVLLQTPRAAPV